VVCSPHSAKSLWVNEEVKIFKAMGRESRVLCLIIDGEPNVSDKPVVSGQECFAQALRHRIDATGKVASERTEPIAADIRPSKDGKRNAQLRLIAGLLSINYAILNDREKRRHTRRQLVFVVGAVFALVATLVVYLAIAQRLNTERESASRINYVNTITQARKKLEEGHPELASDLLWQTPETLRNWEWGYLIRLCDPELTTINLAETGVMEATFTPDSSRIVIISNDGAANLWDIRLGKRLLTFVQHKDVSSVRLSLDGKYFTIVRADGSVEIYNTSTGQEELILGRLPPDCSPESLSQDGKYIIATPRDHSPVVLEVTTGRELLKLNYESTARVIFAVFSLDGKRILTRDTDDIGILWDAETGMKLMQMDFKRRTPTAQYVNETGVFGPGGTSFTSVSDDGVKIWNIQQKEPIELKGHTWAVYSAVYSPDGKCIVTASGDGTARIWDTLTGKQLVVLGEPLFQDPVYSAEFNSTGTQVVTSSRDGTAKVWDAVTGRQLAVFGGEKSLVSAIFSPDDSLILTISSEDICKIWDATVASGPLTIDVDLGSVFFNDKCFNTDGSCVVIVEENKIKLKDTFFGRDLITIPGRRFASFSSDGKRIVAGSDGNTAKIWDSTGKELATLTGNSQVDFAAFSPDGSCIVTKFSDTSVSIWDGFTGKILSMFPNSASHVDSASFSPDSKQIVLGSFTNAAKVYDTATGNELVNLEGKVSGSHAAIFNPKGDYIAAEIDYGDVCIWNVSKGTIAVRLEGQSLPVFSPDGTKIATYSNNGEVQVWQAANWKQIAALPETGEVYSARFSQDGERIITANWDGTLKIWDIATETELISVLVSQPESASFAAFSSSMMHIVAMSFSDTVRIWQTAPFRKELLPGNDSMNWQERYKLWKWRMHDLWLTPS